VQKIRIFLEAQAKSIRSEYQHEALTKFEPEPLNKANPVFPGSAQTARMPEVENDDG
jgi:hypothetical protein